LRPKSDSGEIPPGNHRLLERNFARGEKINPIGRGGGGLLEDEAKEEPMSIEEQKQKAQRRMEEEVLAEEKHGWETARNVLEIRRVSGMRTNTGRGKRTTT